MDIKTLKHKLSVNNVPARWYSLDEGLKPDACILIKNYSIWEFFYMDEKGDRHDFKIFKVDEEAYDYLWKKMERQLIFFKMPVIN
jgi:hypothetical protein